MSDLCPHGDLSLTETAREFFPVCRCAGHDVPDSADLWDGLLRVKEGEI